MTKDELLADAKKARDLGDNDLELAIYKKLDSIHETSAPSQFLSGIGGSILNQASNVADLLPNKGISEKLSQWGQEGINNAPGSAGKAGQLVGDIAPSMLLPGSLPAQVVGNGLLTAATTKGDLKERAKSGAEAATINAVLGKLTDVAGNAFAQKFAKSKKAANVVNADRAGRQAALEEARKANFVISPDEANPSFMNELLASIGGKAATKQAVQQANVGPATAAARTDLGLAPDALLNEKTFDAFIKQNLKPYKAVEALPTPLSLAQGYSVGRALPTAKQDMRDLKVAYDDVRALNRVQAGPNFSTENREKINKAKDLINTIENRFTQRAQAAGKPELVDQLQQARVNFGKLGTVEDSVNKVTGTVDGKAFGKRIDTGKPLTGAMRVAGELEQSFPNAIREAEKIPSPGVNQLMRTMAPLMFGGAGYQVGGNEGAALGAIGSLLAPGMARKILLSPGYQKAFANIPKAEASKTLKVAEQILKSKMTKRVIPGISKEMAQDE